MSLVCLVCWVVSWLVTGVKQGIVGRGRWFDYFGRGRPCLDADDRHDPGSGVGQADARLFHCPDPGQHAAGSSRCVVLYVIWAEIGTCPDNPAIRPGDSTRWSSSGIHLALGLGLAVGLYLQRTGYLVYRHAAHAGAHRPS